MDPKNWLGKLWRGAKARPLLSFFLASLLIRLAFWWLAVRSNVPARFDEDGYLQMAGLFRNILDDLVHFRWPSKSAWVSFYAKGSWPPLHPMLLGLGFFLLGQKLAIARLVVAILSAAATPLVYSLAAKLSGKKVAFAAGCMHLLYPSFLAYSHFLWSETTYILLILLAAYFALAIPDSRTKGTKILHAAGAGFFLGLCGLSRAAVLPVLLLAPLWVLAAVKGLRSRLLLSALVLAMEVIVLLPWQAALFLQEKHFTLLSTAGGYNLFLGNNPWVPEGYGSSWSHRESENTVFKTTTDYAASRSIPLSAASRALAIQEIKKDPSSFLHRCLLRLRMFWASDFFLVRHVLSVSYPPMTQAVAAFLWILVTACYVALVLLSLWGLLSRGMPPAGKWLLLLLVLGGMAPSLVTIAMSRLHLPLLALLLPAAGHGTLHLKRMPARSQGIAMVLLSFLFLFGVLSSLPLVTPLYLRPSSYYSSLIQKADRILGTRTPLTDRIAFRATEPDSPQLLLRVVNSEYIFDKSLAQSLQWNFSEKSTVALVDIFAPSVQEPLEMICKWRDHGEAVLLRPVKGSSWYQWQPTGLPGLEYQWQGGVQLPQKKRGPPKQNGR